MWSRSWRGEGSGYVGTWGQGCPLCGSPRLPGPVPQGVSLWLESWEWEGKEPEDMNSFLYRLTQACHYRPACSGKPIALLPTMRWVRIIIDASWASSLWPGWGCCSVPASRDRRTVLVPVLHLPCPVPSCLRSPYPRGSFPGGFPALCKI